MVAKPIRPKRFKTKLKSTGSFVYFIQRGTNGPIKIGISMSPRARLSSLQSASPEKLNLIACVPGGRDVESQFHERFAQHHISGEWFEPHQDILDYIKGRMTWPR